MRDRRLEGRQQGLRPAGRGYAEKFLMPEGMVMSLPEGASFATGAVLPELYTAVMLNLVCLGELKSRVCAGGCQRTRETPFVPG